MLLGKQLQQQAVPLLIGKPPHIPFSDPEHVEENVDSGKGPVGPLAHPFPLERQRKRRPSQIRIEDDDLPVEQQRPAAKLGPRFHHGRHVRIDGRLLQHPLGEQPHPALNAHGEHSDAIPFQLMKPILARGDAVAPKRRHRRRGQRQRRRERLGEDPGVPFIRLRPLSRAFHRRPRH